MHPSTHTSGRDAGSGWTEPKAKKPAKRKKKSTAKKSTAKKSTAKKSTAKKTGSMAFAPLSALDALEDRLAELGRLRRRVQSFERKLAELSTAVADLAARSPFDLPPDEEIVENPFARWLQDPAIEQYRGQHIALHPSLGIVGHAESPDAVIEMVRARGIPPEEIALDFVAFTPW